MERRVRVLALAGLGLAGVVACATLAVRAPDRIIYSHARHLQEDVACLDCHAGIDATDTFAETFLPTHGACERCHEPAAMERCELCHTAAERARRSEPRHTSLIFSHRTHMPAASGNCMRCHFEVPTAETAEATGGPPMSACGGDCHADLQDGVGCQRCHLSLAQYPLEAIRFATHGAGFERGHGALARDKAEACAQCHDRSYCADCHVTTRPFTPELTHPERVVRAFVHPPPYIALHAIDVERRPETCDGCHQPAFCTSCHASFGLAALTSLREGPHPSGWLDPTSPGFHGFEARRRITSCAGCHDQGLASNCVRCHQVGGTGGNPHPPGFERRGAPEDHRMCRACHWRTP